MGLMTMEEKELAKVITKSQRLAIRAKKRRVKAAKDWEILKSHLVAREEKESK